MADIPEDYSVRIKRLRGRLGLTQAQLAGIVGVSFATVNRWENNQVRPSQLAWSQIEELITGEKQDQPEPSFVPPLLLDFTSDPAAVQAIAEGERLSFGHLAAG